MFLERMTKGEEIKRREERKKGSKEKIKKKES